MPREIDAYPRSLRLTHDPTNQLGISRKQIKAGMSQFTPPLGSTDGMLAFLRMIDEITGWDLTDWYQQILNQQKSDQARWQAFWNGAIQWAVKIADGLYTGNWAELLEQFGIDPGLFDPTIMQQRQAQLQQDIAAAVQMGDFNALLRTLFGQDTIRPVLISSILPQIPSTLLPEIHLSSINAGDSPNYLKFPGFDSPGEIDGAGIWTHDATHGRTSPGCLSVQGDSTEKEIASEYVLVKPGQEIQLGAYLDWDGLASSGTTVTVYVRVFNFFDQQIDKHAVMTLENPLTSSGTWELLTGTYTMPQNAHYCDVTLYVSSSALSGTIRFDDMSLTKTGKIQQNWVEQLEEDFQDTWEAFSTAKTPQDVQNAWNNMLRMMGISVDQKDDFASGAIEPGDIWLGVIDAFFGVGTLSNQPDVKAIADDLNKGNEAFQTLMSGWWTAVTTPGRTWTAMMDDIDDVWSTYLTDAGKIINDEWLSITNLLSNLFGFNITGSAAGTIRSSAIDGWNDQWNEFSAAISGDKADAGQWGWLADIMNDWFHVSSTAHDMSVQNTNTLGERNNKPLIYGLDDTTESNIPFTSTPSAIVVGNSGSLKPIVAFVRCQQDSVKNSIAFLARRYTTDVVNSFYVSLFKVDFTNSKLVHINTSADLGALVGNGFQWVITSASATEVDPGDVLAVVFSGQVALAGQTGSLPAHPNAKLPGLEATMATTVNVNADIPFSQLTFANTNVPYVGFEISDPPPPSYPDIFTPYLKSTTHQIASHLVDGDLVDLVGLSAGGGGQGETGAAQGRGGIGGNWCTKTLVVGTDIAAGESITITVGTGGDGGAYFADGEDGGATTFAWIDPSGHGQTLTAAGGHGGGLVHGAENGLTWGLGVDPQTKTFAGRTYTGGGEQFNGQPGMIPGGGGSGGYAFQYGWAGARGQAWTVERQA